MKKYLFFIPLLLVVLLPHNVFAYDFELNGETITVNDENYIYYFYTNYTDVFEQYDYFIGASTGSGGYYIALFNSIDVGFSSPFVFVDYSKVGQFHRLYLNTSNGYTENKSYTKNSNVFEASQITYSNFDYKYGSKTFLTNITKEDLENYTGKKTYYTITYYLNNEIYKTLEVEKGSAYSIEEYNYNTNLYTFSGWTLETTDIDLNNITGNIVIRATLEEKIINPVYVNNFPISKTDFYTLLVLLGTLIMMLFLRWIFPMNGGKNL